MDETIASVRLVMKYDKGSFSFDKVKMTATDTQIFQLGKAFAQLQEDQPKAICKTVKTLLENY